MMTGNPTPEERLLGIIESRGEPGKRFVFWDVRTWPVLFPGFRKQAMRWVGFTAGWVPRSLGLRQIHQVLGIVLLLSVAGFIYDISRVRPGLADLGSPGVVPESIEGTESVLAGLRPLSEYMEETQKRDLFRLSPPPPESQPVTETIKVEPPPPPPPTPLEILGKKVENLKLVGISIVPPHGKTPKTPIAIIEDTVTRRTYFLKEGEFLDDMQIVSISDGKAVLSYQQAEYVLF